MLNLPEELTNVENAVLTHYAENLHDRTLMHQLESSEFLSRDHNGHGFYTDLRCVQSNPMLSHQSPIAASAQIDGALCGFLLWLKDGYLDCLEGYSLSGDGWPGNPDPLPPNQAAVNFAISELRLD